MREGGRKHIRKLPTRCVEKLSADFAGAGNAVVLLERISPNATRGIFILIRNSLNFTMRNTVTEMHAIPYFSVPMRYTGDIFRMRREREKEKE